MPPGLRERALREFGVTAGHRPPDAQSGAGVWAVRTAAGQPAYLKVSGDVAAARRELRFYRELAPVAPVRTPALLGAIEDADGVVLLLAAAGQARGPASWPAEAWARLGADLAALHGMPLPPDPRWRTPDLAVGPDPFWVGRLPELPELFADRAALRAAMLALPPAFVHGDCHPSNLLHSGGGLVFCDWQSAGIGRPAADLAFLSVRATPAGVVVPPALMDAYATVRGCDRRTLRRAVVAEEIAVLLGQWPPYARLHDAAGVGRVVRRARDLARVWLAEGDPDTGTL
jgi:aminoglycoside phosphotransferase (APT) family kinase protein